MILITGMSGSGKTYTSRKLSDALKLPAYQTDELYTTLGVYFNVNPIEFIEPSFWSRFPGLEELKGKVYPHYPSDSILEGCGVFYDHKYIPGEHTIFLLVPTYEAWLKQWGQARNVTPVDNLTNVQAYKRQLEIFSPGKDFPDHYLVDETIDLFDEINPPVMYWNQTPTFVQEKFDSLKLGDLSGLSVIDLGGNNGEIAVYCLEVGAKSALVVDNNWQRLNRAVGHKRKLFNCEHLERFTDTCDVLLSLSMIHYIKDKDKFIREASRIVKKVFVLECPIDGTRVDAIVPTQDEIMSLMTKYFAKVEIVGDSPSPDSSHRKVFKGYI